MYDFTDNQCWNPLRARRIVIRGSIGEIVDDHVVRLIDPTTPIDSHLTRRLAGLDLNLEGLEVQRITFEGKVWWENQFPGARFSEDDLAVAGLLQDTVEWCRGLRSAPYPLADGCQDHFGHRGIRADGATCDDSTSILVAPGRRNEVTVEVWAKQRGRPEFQRGAVVRFSGAPSASPCFVRNRAEEVPVDDLVNEQVRGQNAEVITVPPTLTIGGADVRPHRADV